MIGRLAIVLYALAIGWFLLVWRIYSPQSIETQIVPLFVLGLPPLALLLIIDFVTGRD